MFDHDDNFDFDHDEAEDYLDKFKNGFFDKDPSPDFHMEILMSLIIGVAALVVISLLCCCCRRKTRGRILQPPPDGGTLPPAPPGPGHYPSQQFATVTVPTVTSMPVAFAGAGSPYSATTYPVPAGYPAPGYSHAGTSFPAGGAPYHGGGAQYPHPAAPFPAGGAPYPPMPMPSTAPSAPEVNVMPPTYDQAMGKHPPYNPSYPQ